MTDISVESKEYQTDARQWLLTELVGHQQSVATTFGVLNFALFDAEDHYPNGYIPSGTVLGRVTTGGRLGPYDDAASDGRQTAVGHLYNAITVPADTARKVAAAVIDCFAVIDESKLPTNHGLDAAARADLPLIKYRQS
jgi:hypothetical protein